MNYKILLIALVIIFITGFLVFLPACSGGFSVEPENNNPEAYSIEKDQELEELNDKPDVSDIEIDTSTVQEEFDKDGAETNTEGDEIENKEDMEENNSSEDNKGLDNNDPSLSKNSMEDHESSHNEEDLSVQKSGEGISENEQEIMTMPEVQLKIVIGPEYAQDDQVCYYRVKADVKGNPLPLLTFNRDDSNGSWGTDTVQVNLMKDQSYVLTCRAENTEGVSESSVVLNWVSKEEVVQPQDEIQVDYNDIDSFLIDVNLSLQQVTVYYKGAAIRNMVCSAGRPETPTPMGEFKTYQKIYYQYVPKFAQGAFYWTRFYGSYLFHSIPTDINRNFLVEEFEKLGNPASHGCVRLKVEDAKWMYDILPLGILVHIHN